MPPVSTNWNRFRWEEANEWNTYFHRQIEEFKAIIGSNVATNDTFDVDQVQ